MSHPVYKIEIYDTTPTLKHTITSDAINIQVKEVVNETPGIFSFILPTKKNGSTYYYNDVVQGWTAKIWMDYDSVSGDPLTVGTIYNISATLSTREGYIRVFVGMNQGEVLKRRQKTKYWYNIGASTIVTQLANDLSLGTTEIATDATQVILEVCNEPYWTVLRKVSDYWKDAGTQIKKDFYVTWDNKLLWKARPLRSGASVETLTAGENIVSYNVNRDLKSVGNKLKIYGVRGLHYPTDGDAWTEASTTGWSITCDQGTHDGSVSVSANAYEVGTKSLRALSAEDWGHTAMLITKVLSPVETLYNVDSTHLKFWIQTATCPAVDWWVMLYAPDSSNYFKIQPGVRIVSTEMKHFDLSMREFTSITGNPDKSDIASIVWRIGVVGGAYSTYIDGLHFADKRFRSVEEDATSQTNYGIREFTETDDSLLSNSDCQKRGQAYLYQMKDPPIRLDVVTPLNTNIKIGDRLSMTIPAEGISAVNFDVLSVEHNISVAGAVTRAIMVNSANRRRVQAITPNEILKEQVAIQKKAARGIQLSLGFAYFP